MKIYFISGIRRGGGDTIDDPVNDVSDNVGSLRGAYIVYDEENNKCFMVDSGTAETGNKLIVPFLQNYLGINYLDAIFITHFDYDHSEGVQEIIKGLNGEVGAIYSSGVYDNETSPKYERNIPAQDEVNNQCDEYNIDHIYVSTSDSFQYGDMFVNIVNPLDGDYNPPQERGGENNHGSHNVVVYVQYGDFYALFTGDHAGSNLYNNVYDRIDKPVTYYTMPHHGNISYGSSTYLDGVYPKIASYESYGTQNWEDMYDFLEGREGTTPWSLEIDGDMEIKAFKNGRYLLNNITITEKTIILSRKRFIPDRTGTFKFYTTRRNLIRPDETEFRYGKNKIKYFDEDDYEIT